MSDVILVYPRTGMDVGSSVAPPHNLLCVAAPLDKAGYKVKIIDQRVERDWHRILTGELMAQPPLFVGISAMTGTQIKSAIQIARVVRVGVGHVPIVWGGPHPTLLPDQVLESGLADYVCVGEVDETIVDITRNIANGKAEKIIRSPLPDMEKLLPTPWHLVDVEKYVHPDIYLKKGRHIDCGQTSRGCPFNCKFCSSASIRERKWRAMSAGKAVEMIARAVRDFRLDGIWLRDDEFYINQRRASEIAEALVPLHIRWYTSGTRVDVFNKTPDEQVALYKRSGAHTLKFGAESGSNKILALMGKGITREETLAANRKAAKHGIIPAFALMCGFPTETFAEMNETIDMARRIRKDNPRAQFETMAVYTALPGTPMWDLAVSHGLKSPTRLDEWAEWNFDEYDLAGRRIPWFNAKEREAIGNLCYISLLSNAVPNVLDSLVGLRGRLFRALYPPLEKYYNWRFFGKHYRQTWELSAVRSLRRLVFYQNHK